jgi:hypothetical protein
MIVLFPAFGPVFWVSLALAVAVCGVLWFNQRRWTTTFVGLGALMFLLLCTDVTHRKFETLVVYDVFALWTLPFWCLVATEVVFLFWCVAKRRGFFALGAILLGLGAVQFFGDIPVFELMWHNKLLTIGAAALYLIASVPWGFTKWWSFVKDNQGRYDHVIEPFVRQHPDWSFEEPDKMTAEQKVELKEYFDQHCHDDEEEEPVEYMPDHRKHKEDIMAWMMLWPFSMLETALNDPLTKLFRLVYYKMEAKLEYIRNSV